MHVDLVLVMGVLIYACGRCRTLMPAVSRCVSKCHTMRCAASFSHSAPSRSAGTYPALMSATALTLYAICAEKRLYEQ